MDEATNTTRNEGFNKNDKIDNKNNNNKQMNENNNSKTPNNISNINIIKSF